MKINGKTHYLWRAMDHEGEVLESYVTKRWDRKAVLEFQRKTMRRFGAPNVIVTDKLRSYGAAMKMIGIAEPISSRTAPLLLPSGVNLVRPERAWVWETETASHLSDGRRPQTVLELHNS